MTPSDYWAFTTARRELGGIVWPPSYEARLPTARLAQLALSVATELDGVRAGLQGGARAAGALREAGGVPDVHLAHHPGTGLRRACAAVGNLGLRRPRRLHGCARDGLRSATATPKTPSTSSSAAISRLTDRRRSTTSGSGRASRALAPISASLERQSLRTFRDEQGRTLYDLPRAPLPNADTPAPVRLIPRFDNLVLSHADRSRILGDIPPSRIVTNNGIVRATILVDGFVAGTWQLDKGRVALEPFVPLGRGDVLRAGEWLRSNGWRHLLGDVEIWLVFCGKWWYN